MKKFDRSHMCIGGIRVSIASARGVEDDEVKQLRTALAAAQARTKELTDQLVYWVDTHTGAGREKDEAIIKDLRSLLSDVLAELDGNVANGEAFDRKLITNIRAKLEEKP
jgi:hypothetical protein